MDNRYEIAEQNGMSREFAEWFFDNKKAGCGNVWFMMMAAMWEGWQGRAAMLQGSDGNAQVIPDGWVLVPEEPTHEMLEAGDEQFGTYDVYRRMIAAALQQEVKP
ncbi:hypothetical protein PVM11_13550 [Enterobacter roggenkampii]|uniref:hypothetical protein n=1 Tax=Enterobacter roggenkampii TaxID=1812935 RepID=UPI002378042A|nr:hypothetical protein [Enterobacter roggenkampii]MDD9239917.1 hypothetical protein [Enterobacter roggenkampii]